MERKPPKALLTLLNNLGIWLGCAFTMILWYIITNAYIQGGKVEIAINLYGEANIEFLMMPFLVLLVFFSALKNTEKKAKNTEYKQRRR